MKKYLYNIYFDFCSDIRFTKTQVLFSLDPPASFPYTVNSLTGVTGQISSLSEWFGLHTWDQPSLLKLGQTSVMFVFLHWTLSLFHVSTDLIHLYSFHVLYMFHTVRPKRIVSVNWELYTFVSGFMSRSHSKSTFPQSSLKLYGGHNEKIVQYFLWLYFRWTVDSQSTLYLAPWAVESQNHLK